MTAVKKLFFAYLSLLALAVIAYGVSRKFTPPRDKDTLYTIYNSTIRSMDPVKIADQPTSDIMGHVYETLYNYRFGGAVDEAFPQLAADFPKVSADGLTYTFPLRHGVRYYDPWGKAWPKDTVREVTAEDFVYSWKRFADANLKAPSFSTFLQGNVVGLDAFYDASAKPNAVVDYNQPIEGLKAIDKYTFQVKLVSRIPNFVQYAAYMGLAPVPREAVEAYGNLSQHPVGTGPYYLEDYRLDARIVLNANPYYRGKPDGNPGDAIPEADRLPHIKRQRYDYAPEQLTAYYQFLQGGYDVLSVPTEAFAAAIDEKGNLRPALARKHIVLTKRTDLGLYYLQLNLTDKVIGKNLPLRQAMSLAIDRAEFIRVYLNGRGEVATGILPPDVPNFDPNYHVPFIRHDVDAARAKVREAVAVNGGPLPTFTLLMNGTSTLERQYAEFFCAQFREVGLGVTPEYNEYANVMDRIDKRAYQITLTGWAPDYPDEKTYLRLFDATLAPPPGSNASEYVNDEFQAALVPSLSMERSPRRDALYRKMRDLVDRDLPVIPLYYPLRFGLRYDWFGGFKNQLLNQGFFSYQTLDSDRRSKLIGGF